MKTESPIICRGVRGAITAPVNSKDETFLATRELLYTIIQQNNINPDDVASAYFTTTEDLDQTYPATAARQLGWFDVPLLCGHEIRVPTGLTMCVRVLLHWNTSKSAQEIIHVYLRDSTSLRPDKDKIPPVPAEEVERMMQLAAKSPKHPSNQ